MLLHILQWRLVWLWVYLLVTLPWLCMPLLFVPLLDCLMQLGRSPWFSLVHAPTLLPELITLLLSGLPLFLILLMLLLLRTVVLPLLVVLLLPVTLLLLLLPEMLLVPPVVVLLLVSVLATVVLLVHLLLRWVLRYL